MYSNMEKINLAIFVSGGGTNCENIIRHFQDNPRVSIPIVVSSSSDAYAITRARNLGVPATVITRKQLNEQPDIVFAATEGCDYIILAGFLPKVPEYLIERFPNRIINLHPALLPSFVGAHAIQDAFDADATRRDGEDGMGVGHAAYLFVSGGQSRTTTERSTSPSCILAKAASTSPMPIFSVTKAPRSKRPCL